MSKFCKFLILNLLALALNNCAPKIADFASYQNENFPKSNFLPTKENLQGIAPKVVVFEFNENDNQIAKQAGLGKSLALDVENILTENRLAGLVDRNIAKKLEKEILLSEMSNTDVSYLGPIVANYAISGSISNAGFDKKYSNGMTIYTKQTGLINTPPSFRYNADVAGNIKIYEIPSMNVVENFEFSGSEARSENVQKSGGFAVGGLIDIGSESSKGIDRDDSLVRKAAEDAISNVAIALKNAFAKKAYVLEKRSLKKKAIFKISLGSDDGLRQGDKFEVIGKFEIENPITHEVEMENRILGTGVVSDIINPKFSFVILDKKEFNDKVRLGDIIKFKYQKSFGQKINQISKFIPN